jgi:hypothetical protein
MRHWKLLTALVLFVVVLATLFAAGSAARGLLRGLAGGDAANVALASSYELNETHDGALVVLAQTITLGDGSVVNGDAALVGNSVELNGHIAGALSASASQIVIGPGATVGGDTTLTADSVRIDGALASAVTVQAASVTLGPGSQLSDVARVCAGSLNDERAVAEPLVPCTAPTPNLVDPLWLRDAAAAGATVLALAGVLAGGVLAAVPHLVSPLRMARLDEGLRLRPTPRVLTGVVALLLWGVAGVLLMALPGGGLTQLLIVVFLGVSFLAGAPLIWLGVALAGLWLGRPILRLIRRPRAEAPWAALVGGLLISLFLALVGLSSTLGLAGLALLAALGLAAVSAGRAAGAVGDGSRPTSYFVQG